MAGENQSQFGHGYIRYVQRQFNRIVSEDLPLLAIAMKACLRKTAVSHALDDFEQRAICSAVTRDVHVRIAGHRDEIYLDLCDDNWSAVRITAAGWSIVKISATVRFEHTAGCCRFRSPSVVARSSAAAAVEHNRRRLPARDCEFARCALPRQELFRSWLFTRCRVPPKLTFSESYGV